MKQITSLQELSQALKQETDAGIHQLFQFMRQDYLARELDDELSVFVTKVLGKDSIGSSNLTKEQRIKLKLFIKKQGLDWADPDFHLRFRLTHASELKLFFPQLPIERISRIIQQGFNLSIMPLNLAINDKDMLNKFIPKADFFEKHSAKQKDPYGIFSKGSKIVKQGVYIGSQKFPRSLLMNITGVCPIGCVGCYKGEFTRISNAKFFTSLTKATAVQVDRLVKHLNKHPRIAAVIVSGGEPLLLPNSGMKRLLAGFEKAKHLSELRICTGSIFQGLPFRIDDKLLSMLSDFQKKTGIQVHFNAHLSHPAQFSPEALLAIHMIRKHGFFINSQVPLQKDVNIFPDNKKKTVKLLERMAELQGVSGVRPYKYILHMNCGSLEYSVPLEFMLDLLGELKFRTNHPFPETWQPVSCSILCKAGNILLSPQLKHCMSKKVMKDFVEYSIPVPEGKVTYREPLMTGFNDK